METGFKIVQGMIGMRPREQLALYAPSSDTRSTNKHPLVLRRAIYRPATAHEQFRNGEPILWPDINVRFFLVGREQMVSLDEAVHELERLVPTLSIREEGIGLGFWYKKLDTRSASSEAKTNYTPSEPQYREIDLLSEPSFQITYCYDETSPATPFNSAWEKAWVLAQSICTPSSETDKIHDEFDVPIEDYARILQKPDDS